MPEMPFTECLRTDSSAKRSLTICYHWPKKKKKHTFSSNIVVSQEFLIAVYAAQKVQSTEFLAVLYCLNLQS